MKAKLYREDAEVRGNDIVYSLVGPGHDRAYFTLIPLAGYSAVNRLEKHPYFAPPFKIYSMSGVGFPQEYKTAGAAKRAVRDLIKGWVLSAPKTLSWRAEDSGVHWTAEANGIDVANYYYCPEPTGHWHKGFRVWFGGTYYVTDFHNPDEARGAVACSYELWLTHATKCLLSK